MANSNLHICINGDSIYIIFSINFYLKDQTAMNLVRHIVTAFFLCNAFFIGIFASDVKLICSDREVILTNDVAKQFKIIDICLDDYKDSTTYGENSLDTIERDSNGCIPISFPNIHSSAIHLLEMFVTGYRSIKQYSFGSFANIIDCLNVAEQLEAPPHVRDALEKRFFSRCANNLVPAEQDKTIDVILHGTRTTLDTIKARYAYYKNTPTHDLISHIPTYSVTSLEQLQHDFYIAQSVVAPEILSGLAYRLLEEYQSYYNHPNNKEEKEKISSYLLSHITNQSGEIMRHGTKFTWGKSVPCYILFLNNCKTLQVLDGIEKRVSSDTVDSIIGIHISSNQLKYAEIARFKKVFPNLEHIYCFRNQITHLSSSDVAAMEGIKVALNNNKISSIEPSPRKKLFFSPDTRIWIENNPLTSHALQNIHNSFNGIPLGTKSENTVYEHQAQPLTQHLKGIVAGYFVGKRVGILMSNILSNYKITPIANAICSSLALFTTSYGIYSYFLYYPVMCNKTVAELRREEEKEQLKAIEELKIIENKRQKPTIAHTLGALKTWKQYKDV
ncbi:MAG: hypothetical protein WCE21_05510 [Candidatus Babeliales bacterium]